MIRASPRFSFGALAFLMVLFCIVPPTTFGARGGPRIYHPGPGTPGKHINYTLTGVSALEAEVLNAIIYKIGPHLPPPGNISLGLSVELQSVIRISEAGNILHSRVRKRVSWVDERLAQIWPDEGLTDMYIKRELLWKPAVPVRNLADEPKDIVSSSLLKITSGGRVAFEDIQILDTTCNINVKNYPYDTELCYIVCNALSREDKLWELLDPALLRARRAPASHFVENSEWEVRHVRIKKAGYNAITEVKLVRYLADPFFYLVMPGIVITLVSFLQFFLPLDGGERTGIGVTCMLAMVVFNSILDEKFSPDQDNIPRLAWFFALLTVLISITTALSVLAIRLFNNASCGGNAHKAPPHWLSTTFGWLAKGVCRRDDARFLLSTRPSRVSGATFSGGGNNNAAVDSSEGYEMREKLHNGGESSRISDDRLDSNCQLPDGDQWQMIAYTLDTYSLIFSVLYLVTVCFAFLIPVPQ